ncbi:DUF2156 domain-containing protein [Helicobacter sp. NHP19-012]|uniref:DUF2156 domain-containing protein n=1 Tax=Helicobacter gastrofelis TaxID=2849642 RepID=A0ABM7SG16_9HELI|nr:MULTISPECIES: phosphatidylglycerol lysyltransferase domain-containing protein [unclassified Helicobacter]BCZ19812.1 DUF2156 domain-containing protein [Helicobacter sp. NHP19-012]GMB95487.1 DUF2156 domain-containing protein [Helicobacter sp. NHP22-001]
MEFNPLNLAQKDRLDSALKADHFLVGDVSFTNLYLWQGARKICLAFVEGCVVVQTTYPNESPFYFYPIGSGDKRAVLDALITYTKAQNQPLEFRALQSEHKDELEQLYPHAFSYEAKRDRFDYIYSVTELIALSGKKFHKKKNHLNAFLKLYPRYSYEPISPTNIPDLMQALKEWHKLDDPQDLGLEHEHRGILSVLEIYESLPLLGGVIRIEGRIVAMSFGEKLNPDMALIHIEKADPSVRGAYQMVNQQLLVHAFADCVYVNREEDLGIEGLRQAKMGYNPVFFVEKYHAHLV